MKDPVDALHGAVENVGVLDVAALRIDRHARIAQRVAKVLGSSTLEVVEDDDLRRGRLRELLDEVAADEAGAADDEEARTIEFQLTPTSASRRSTRPRGAACPR